VSITNGLQWLWQYRASVILPHGTSSWLAGGVALLFIILRGLQRLLFEWQRRKTLIELLDKAPAGSEIIHVDGARGARMKVTVGGNSDRAPGLPGDST
jgi:hypothetical protein